MLLRNGDINDTPELTVKDEVAHAQIDFINSNRINSVTTMAISGLLFCLILSFELF